MTTVVVSSVNGPPDEGFPDRLRQAILMWPFDIPGFLGFGGNLVVTEGNGSNSTSTPTASPEGDGTRGGVAGIEDDTQPEGKNVNPGAFVAAGVAALTLIIVAMFVVRRRRNSDESLSKHRELADDDDEGGLTTDDDDTAIHASTVVTLPQKSYVIGEENDSLRSWNDPGGDGQEVFVPEYQHAPDHMCSSPNCEACEIKRRQGTTFVMADSSLGQEHATFESFSPEDSVRQYEHDDTVDL